jgi:uncharacterized protein YlxP (DUF503 family)
MVIGTCSVDLYLPASRSLKQKRQIIKSLKTRLRNKFNISLMEDVPRELWQRSTLVIVTVADHRRFANEILSKVILFINREGLVNLLDYKLEFL